MAWTLYYDGGCNLCHHSKLRVEHWADRAGIALTATPLQSPEGQGKGYGSAMVLETESGTYAAVHAWFRLLEIAPIPLRWLGYLGRIPPVRWIAWPFYEAVARTRYKVFGRRACELPRR